MGPKLKGTMGKRHLDGWDNILNAEIAGKTISEKLRRNADNLDEDDENEQDDRFVEAADFFEQDE